MIDGAGFVSARRHLFRQQTMQYLTGTLVLLAVNTVALAQNHEGSVGISTPATQTVARIFVNRLPIFDSARSFVRPARRLANALHKVTREETILSEIGVAPGELIEAADIAEIERILRRLDLFASVSVQLESGEIPGSVDLHIRTRDRLSIVAGVSGSFVGGVGELGFTVGERNVAGLGDSLLLSYSGNTDDEIRGSVSYRDLHFIKPGQRAAYSAGRTEEGSFFGLRFSRPFRTLDQSRSWSLQISGVDQDFDFYERGLSVVQIPEDRESLSYESVWRSGSRELSWRRGLTLLYDDRVYQPSRGTRAATIAAPSDSTRLFAGAIVAVDRRTGFSKVTGLDTLRFTQDLAFGTTAEVRAGLQYRRDVTEGRDIVNPLISTRLSSAFARGETGFFRLSLNAAATLSPLNTDIAEERAWSLSASAIGFNRTLRSQTLAFRIDYTVADGGSDVPIQQTLGEDNGLRGYARRFFSGRERLRINLENRIDPGWTIGVFDFGVVGFFDAGWVAEESESDRTFNRSAGVGLRLGSSVLLGSGVIRMDLAFPFDGEDDDPLFSVSLGQVFSFLGNRNR